MVGGGCGFLGCCLLWFCLVWVIVLVLTMFYCLIGAPDFPWLWFWGFMVVGVVLYWWVWVDVAGGSCWICYLGVVAVVMVVVDCTLRLAC